MNLTSPIYTNEDKAREHLESILWPSGAVCPRCKATGERVTKLEGKSTRPGVYKCKDCRKPFSVTVGTVFERSHIPLTKWVMAAHLMASSKKGMSAHQLHRMLNVTYETAWFMAHRLRECMTSKPSGPLGGTGKTVEVDEAYVGGKSGNKAFGPRPKKAAVVTLVERGGDARSFHVANVTAKTLRTVIFKNADRKSKLATDEWLPYRPIGREFANHGAVRHGAGEYVRGEWHNNTAESFFAVLKRGINGIYHSVSEAHLHRYLVEFDFRYNARKVEDSARAAAMLGGATGKRLMYRQAD